MDAGAADSEMANGNGKRGLCECVCSCGTHGHRINIQARKMQHITLLVNYASPHHITNRGKLPLHSKHESGKSITLDNGATLTFTLIASWHDMGTKMGSANRRRKGV